MTLQQFHRLPTIERDLNLFRDALDGASLRELTTRYQLSAPGVLKCLQRTLRRLLSVEVVEGLRTGRRTPGTFPCTASLLRLRAARTDLRALLERYQPTTK